MKNLYNKKKLLYLLEEYPIIYIYCLDNNSNEKKLIKNNIKHIKIKNSLLKTYNKNLFNGNVLLIYGKNIENKINELKNIVGIFCRNNKNQNYFITLNKFLKILIYYQKSVNYSSILNILNGSIFWFLLKF